MEERYVPLGRFGLSTAITAGPPTVFVAPPGADPDEAYDPDGPWELVHPTCPPAPPPDLGDGEDH